MEGHQKRMAHLVSKYFFLLRKWKETRFLEGCLVHMEPNCSPQAGFFRLGSILGQGAYTGPAKEDRDPASKQLFFM